MEVQSKKIILTTKETMDFCWCPRYYDLKKEDKNEYNLREFYDETIHKCFYDYLWALQNDNANGLMRILKTKFGNEWIKAKRNSQIMITPSATKRDTYDTKRKAGINSIFAFHEMMQEKQCPVVINKEYILPITENISIKGKWEYIREITVGGEKIIQILKFKSERNKFDTNNSIARDIELTASDMAFRKIFNYKEVQVVFVDIYTKKMHVSTRTENDHRFFKKTVISVANCIRHNIRCVSPDRKCYNCDYRDVCGLKFSKGE